LGAAGVRAREKVQDAEDEQFVLSGDLLFLLLNLHK